MMTIKIVICEGALNERNNLFIYFIYLKWKNMGFK